MSIFVSHLVAAYKDGDFSYAAGGADVFRFSLRVRAPIVLPPRNRFIDQIAQVGPQFLFIPFRLPIDFAEVFIPLQGQASTRNRHGNPRICHDRRKRL